MCLSQRFEGGGDSANWNYREWAVVILFGLIFIEGVGGDFLDFSANPRYQDGKSFFFMAYDYIDSKENPDFSHNNLWNMFVVVS